MMPSLSRNAAVAGVYAVLGLVSLDLHSPDSTAPMTYLPSGLAVLAIYSYGVTVVPGLLVGAAALVLYQGPPLETLNQHFGFILQASIGVIEALAANFAFHLFQSRARPSDLSFSGLAVLLAGGTLGAMIGGTLGAPSLWLNGFIPVDIIPITVINWALADMLGIITIMPIATAYLSHGWSMERKAETGLIIALLSALLYVYFSGGEMLFPIFLFFVLVSWASIRLEGLHAPLIASAVACLIIVGEAQGLNHFKTHSHITNINAFCHSLILSSLFIRILIRRLSEQTALTHKLELDQMERNRQMEQLNRVLTVNEMGSSILHEINTPLQAISTRIFTGMQKLVAGDLDRREFKELLERIQHSVDSIAHIQKRYKGFISRDYSPNDAVDITLAARAAVSMLKPEWKRENVVIENDIPPDLPMGEADITSIEQIFVNLIKNAIEAYECAPLNARIIRLAGWREKDTVCFSVSDRAGGIPTEKQKSVFDPLVSDKPGGTGLGLAICRSIAEGFGGNISLSSDGVRATTLTVTLNRKQDAA